MIPYLTVDHVSAIGDLGVALAAAFASWQGIKGLNAWRQEKLGSRRIDLAEDALFQVYETENALRIIRSPFGYAGEAEGRDPDPAESDIQKRNRDTAFTTMERANKHQEKFDQLHVSSLRLKAVFGDEYAAPLQEIRDCLHLVRIAAATLFDTPYVGFNDADFVKELQSEIWSMGSRDLEEGKMGTKLKAAVEKAESLLGRHLRNPR